MGGKKEEGTCKREDSGVENQCGQREDRVDRKRRMEPEDEGRVVPLCRVTSLIYLARVAVAAAA